MILPYRLILARRRLATADSDTHDIDVLNSLVATIIDSAEGYAEAANQIKNPHISASFLRWSEDRQLVVELLKTQVSSLGVTPRPTAWCSLQCTVCSLICVRF